MKHHVFPVLAALAVSGSSAFGQEVDIQPETLTVEERISEGDHVYIMDMAITGSSAIYVLNAEDFSLEGNIGAGTFSQMMFTPDKSSLYTSSVYMRRYTYGELEAVIHEWDPVTLERKREFVVSDKMAHTLSQKGVLNITADGGYLIVQNATPATSVNVVDLAAEKDLVEVPTPGCWTAYPPVEGAAFTTICGDGTLVKYSFSADGTVAEPGKSEKIFDADEDPIYGNAMRIDGNLVYVSYGGVLHFVDDSGDVPTLVKKVEFAQDGWAPTGYNLMAYHEPSGTLFITMHSEPFDGSHKVPAEEIWAIDIESEQVVGRGAANGEANITVSSGETPAVIGVDHHGGAHLYDVTLGDEVTITQAASREGIAAFPTILATDY